MSKALKSWTDLAMAMFCLLCLGGTMTSCGNEDEIDEEDFLIGKWPAMIWETEVKMDAKHNIAVPQQGGTYVFTCTNYKRPWISEAWEVTADKQEKEFYTVHGSKDDIHNLETLWGKVHST